LKKVGLKSTAFVTALMTLFGLLVPFAGPALANHGSDGSHTLSTQTSAASIFVGNKITLTPSASPSSTGNAVGTEIDLEVETNAPLSITTYRGGVATTVQSNDGNTPLSPDASCVIETGTQCTIELSSTLGVKYTVRTWVDDDHSNATFDADQTEGEDQAATPGGRPEADDTDVVSASWYTDFVSASPDAKLDCRPEGGRFPRGSNASFNCEAFADLNGDGVRDPEKESAIGGVLIDGETLSGANNPDGSSQSQEPSADHNNAGTTDAWGTAKVVISHWDMAEVGPANVCFWIDGDNDLQYSSAGSAEDGGGCATEPGDEPESVKDPTDVVIPDWLQRGTPYSLTISPREVTKAPGSSVTFTATVKDDFGDPVANQKVDFNLLQGSKNDDGGVELDSAITNNFGQASFTYTGKAGRDGVAAYVDNDGNNVADVNRDAGAISDTGHVTFSFVTPNSKLDCTPEESRNVAGVAQTYACALWDDADHDGVKDADE
jgi:hypothetical protein